MRSAWIKGKGERVGVWVGGGMEMEIEMGMWDDGWVGGCCDNRDGRNGERERVDE